MKNHIKLSLKVNEVGQEFGYSFDIAESLYWKQDLNYHIKFLVKEFRKKISPKIIKKMLKENK